MSYHVIDPDDVPPTEGRPSDTWKVSKAAGMQNMGVRLYSVRPGEDIPYPGMHYHDEQEEGFYVAEGELRIETPDTEYTIDQGEFFFVEPGNPHRAYNHDSAAETALVVAMGAPKVPDGHAYDP